jgi:hypothetical protein
VGGVFSCKWPVVTAAEQNASRYFPQNMAVFSQKIAKREERASRNTKGKNQKGLIRSTFWRPMEPFFCKTVKD